MNVPKWLNVWSSWSKFSTLLKAWVLVSVLTGCANPDAVKPNDGVTDNTEVALSQMVEYAKVWKHPQVRKVSGGVEVVSYFSSSKEDSAKLTNKPIKYTIQNVYILKKLGIDSEDP